jgi:hypothetical protein
MLIVVFRETHKRCQAHARLIYIYIYIYIYIIQVSLVKHISLPSHASHKIWRQTCRGAPPFIRFWLQRGKKGKKESADLAASEEREEREERVAAFLNGLRLVQMGGGATCAPYIHCMYTSMTKV